MVDMDTLEEKLGEQQMLKDYEKIKEIVKQLCKYEELALEKLEEFDMVYNLDIDTFTFLDNLKMTDEMFND